MRLKNFIRIVLSFLKGNCHFLLFCLIFFMGCDEVKRMDPRTKLILKTKKEFFRGFDFDMGIREVKDLEKAKLVEEQHDYLKYRIDADSIGEKEYAEIEYFFNSSDQLDVFLTFYSVSKREDIEPLINELKKYFEKRYGRAERDELGWYNWKFNDKTGIPGTIEINLVGETDEDYLGVELEMLKYYEFEEKS